MRKISYIHLYNDNHEGRGVGFVKLDARNGVFRFTVQVKGIYTNGSENCRVYALVHRDSGMDGCLIDEFPVVNGAGEYKAVYKESELLKDGSRVDEMTGLIFLLESKRVAAAVWDENMILSRDRLMALTGGSGNKEEERKAGPETDSQYKTETVADAEQYREKMEDAVTERTAEEYSFPNETEENFARKFSEYEEEELVARQTAAQGFNPAWDAQQETPEEFDAAAMQTEAENESQMAAGQTGTAAGPGMTANVNGLSMKWQQIKNSFPMVKPFEYDTGMEFVNIGPKDLRMLKREYWILGNNSFLLHGYYNYRYLILGYSRDDDRFCLGIPGIYHEREQTVADMFGFGSFWNSLDKPKAQGCFGYFMKEVDLQL